MSNWILNLFSSGEGLPAGSREWLLESEGIPMGWAFLIFLVLAGGCSWAYLRCAPGLSRGLRIFLTILRMVIIALFLVLLVKPVIHLTINQPVRQSLLVLLDNSQSMLLNDRRSTPEDLKRAALAAGLIDPGKGLNQDLPPGAGAERLNGNRWDLLQKLAANGKLNLWPRLQEKSDLTFFKFGRDAIQAGTPVTAEGGTDLSIEETVAFFKAMKPEEPATATGESLRQVLEQSRGQAVAGILLVTDGANNSGLPPIEAARMVKEQNIPLFIYGVGVTSPIDLSLRAMTAPQLAFVKEKVDVKMKLRAQGLGRTSVTATLKANGAVVDERKVELTEDGEQEVSFQFVPQEIGELRLEASVPVQNGEISKDNNIIATKLRVVDNKIHVLFIDQDPRWDFRYLLAYLQRDRRLDVKCVLIDGEPGLDKLPDSPFLKGLPEDREGILKYEIIILGDISPKDLGETRMKLIAEAVEQAGAGVIFLAGPKFNPSAYAGTPLEALLPVVPDTALSAEQRTARSKDPIKLKLTSVGETSSYLQLVEDPVENQKIWDSLPGARWTAPVARAKPGAEVLLVDSRSDKAGQSGAMPVMATQGYGAGETVFIGTDETYRWRSRIGEKYYSQIWGLIMQSLSLKRLEGASSRTQLKPERERYFVGDKVVISGKVYKEGYEVLTAAALQGRLKIAASEEGSKQPEKVVPLDVSAVAGQAGDYRAEFTAELPGIYRYSTLQDPEGVVKFEVIEPKLEQMETALNERILKAMADTAKGRFLREEDLDQLPSLVSSQSATVAMFRKIDLFHSPWWMALLFVVMFLEWLLRRLKQLK